MTRTEYLAQLERYLRKLPKEDYDEVMDYFTELFEDAGAEGEADLMTNLGSPKEAAHYVMADLLDKKLKDERDTTNRCQLILLVILGIFAAPVHRIPPSLFPDFRRRGAGGRTCLSGLYRDFLCHSLGL